MQGIREWVWPADPPSLHQILGSEKGKTALAYLNIATAAPVQRMRQGG
jgi:hypothetical protein